MTVLEFIEKYNNMSSADIKNKLIKSHIKRTYCPVFEKRIILQRILDRCVVTNEETGLEYIDLMLSKINYTLVLMILYTDLSIDENDNGDALVAEIYDALTEHQIIPVICSLLGESEIKELDSVNTLLMTMFENQNNNINVQLNQFVQSLSQKIGVVLNYINENLDFLVESLKDNINLDIE